MNKLKTCFFSIATDEKHQEHYRMMANSLKKFHPDIPLFCWDAKKSKTYTDINWFTKATPIIAHELMNEYDLIIQTNSDQIITGSLDHVLRGDYDVGVVYNYNPSDTKQFGSISVLDIPNQYYYNNGFIAMRNKRFIEQWYNLCNSYHFMNYQYGEQDLMNIILYYGDYKIRHFDEHNVQYKESYWNGLRSFGEWHKAVMRDNKLVLPKTEEGYPERDKELKILHWAGGPYRVKNNYHVYFNQECIVYLDWLVSDSKLSYKEYVKSRETSA